MPTTHWVYSRSDSLGLINAAEPRKEWEMLANGWKAWTGRATALVLLLVLSACGGSGKLSFEQRSDLAGLDNADPQELGRLLNQELLRLGKDPSDPRASSAAAGAEVFDLGASPYSLPGESSISGVTLSWTDYLPGDFDNNGLVSGTDLTPIGLHFRKTVSYRDPADANGVDIWPSGEPTDTGGVQPGTPLPNTSGAYNWMLARVDGDGNAVINVADLVAIAQNWGCHVDGYRIYVKGPGEPDYALLDNTEDPNLPMTLRREDFTAKLPSGIQDFSRPVVYSFNHIFGLDGAYQYIVKGYDSSTGLETPGSLSITVDSASGGIVASGLRAILSADPTSGVLPLTVNFDGELSVGRIARVEWDWNGDGIYDFNSGSSLKTSHTYLQNISAAATMRIIDVSGQIDTASVNISVDAPEGNKAPLAALVSDENSGTAPLKVNFDASGSQDSDGQILVHEWDFDGDGVFDLNSGTIATTSNTYAVPSSYNAQVRVTDDDGGSSVASVALSVLAPSGNVPPVAALSCDPSSGTFPLQVSFDSSGSIDLDGQIIQHNWDFDGDGSVDLSTGTVATAVHTYNSNASFNAKVTVVDDDGDSASAQVAVSVQSPAGNVPPQAALSASPSKGVVPLTVDFDATGSFDADGQIVKHEWDFDGDDLVDLNTGTQGTTSFEFDLNATYQVKLTITDDQGATAMAVATIAAQSPAGNAPPLAALIATPTAGSPPMDVSFDASGSIDLDGQIVKHEWDLDGDGSYESNTGTVPSNNKQYVNNGVVIAKLRVTDDDGGEATATIDIDVSTTGPDSQPPQVTLSATPVSGEVDHHDESGVEVNDGLSVDFSALAIDSDGTVEQFQWDFDGDGVFDFSSGDDSTVTNIYEIAGSYQARVRVIDNDGDVAVSAPLLITVENLSPFVKLSFSPGYRDNESAIETPVSLTLSAQASADIDGQIARFEWDMDGDGDFVYDENGVLQAPDIDSGFQSSTAVDFPSGEALSHTYGVKVTDDLGGSSYESITISTKNSYDEVEDNDLPQQASVFAATPAGNKDIKANLGGTANKGYNADDVDWFYVTYPAGSELDFEIRDCLASEIDLNIRVYDTNATTLLASSLKTDALDKVNNLVRLSAGAVFVKVNRFSGIDLNPRNYTLRVTHSTVAIDETEDNDTQGTADSIDGGSFAPNGHLLNYYALFSGTGNQNDSEDWFTWNVTTGSDFFADAYFKNSDADLDIYLIKPDGTIVASSTSVTDNEHIGISSLASGTYFLKVKKVAGGDCYYQLDLKGGGAPTNYFIQGYAKEEWCCSTPPNGTIIRFTPLGGGTVYETTTDNTLSGVSHNWELMIPNGFYKMSVVGFSGSKLYDSVSATFIEDLDDMSSFEVLNGDVIYHGNNSTYDGDTVYENEGAGDGSGNKKTLNTAEF
ncbi:PKD domain-containing protein [bacterium]|nr:PKD domain-containing protein [bacterium]